MALHSSFSCEFKRQVVLDILEKREGLSELTRKHSPSWNLIRLWVQNTRPALTDEVIDAVRIAKHEEKIAQLERRFDQLAVEVDLLKREVQLGRQRSAVTSS